MISIYTSGSQPFDVLYLLNFHNISRTPFVMNKYITVTIGERIEHVPIDWIFVPYKCIIIIVNVV